MRTLAYFLRWFPLALRYPRVAFRGFVEGLGDLGLTFDDDPSSPRSSAYDVGRTLRRRDA